jgi:hypothetical protein
MAEDQKSQLSKDSAPNADGTAGTAGTDSADSAGKQKPPNLFEDAYGWVVKRFGARVGILLVVLAGAISFVWGGFKDEIKKSDFWQNTAEHFKSIPKADPNTISVYLANLDGDTDGSTTELVFDYIKSVPGITPYRLNRRIKVPDRTPSINDVPKFDQTARDYLKQTGGRVIIWGRVIRRGQSDVVPQLYWTVAAQEEGGWRNNYAPTPDARLPLLFDQDMSWVIQVILSKDSPIYDKHQNPPSWKDQREFIDKLKSVTSIIGPPTSGKCPASPPAVGLWVMLAKAEAQLGAMSADTALLEDAIWILKTAQFYYRCTGDDTWADLALNTQVRAASDLAGLTGQTTELAESDAALSRGLDDAKSRGVFLDAEAKALHCSALTQLESVRAPTMTLDQVYSICVDATQRPLKIEDPQKWAENQRRLAYVLILVAMKNGDNAALRQAVSMLHEVLSVVNVENYKMDWAETQTELGDALSLSSGNSLLLAAGAYRNAIKAVKDPYPLSAASARIRICQVLSNYAVEQKSIAVGHQAENECKMAVDELSQFKSTSSYPSALMQYIVTKWAVASLEKDRDGMINARNELISILDDEYFRDNPNIRMSLLIFACRAGAGLADEVGTEALAASARSQCEQALAFPDLKAISPQAYITLKLGLADALQALYRRRKDESLHRAALEALNDARRVAATDESGAVVLVDALLSRLHKDKAAMLGTKVSFLELSAAAPYRPTGTYLSISH